MCKSVMQLHEVLVRPRGVAAMPGARILGPQRRIRNQGLPAKAMHCVRLDLEFDRQDVQMLVYLASTPLHIAILSVNNSIRRARPCAPITPDPGCVIMPGTATNLLGTVPYHRQGSSPPLYQPTRPDILLNLVSCKCNPAHLSCSLSPVILSRRQSQHNPPTRRHGGASP